MRWAATPVASATGPATGWPAHGPGMLGRNLAQPVAGSYRPGIPMPMLSTGPHPAIAATATSASWATTLAGTASGSVTRRVGTWSRAMVVHVPSA